MHEPRSYEERLPVRKRRRVRREIPLEPRAERVIALLEAAQIPRPSHERREPGPRAGSPDASDEHGGDVCHAQLAQQTDDLLGVIVGRDPDAVLHRAEPEEAEPPPEPGPLEPAILGDLVPDHRPGPDVRGQAAEREDPAVALDQEPLAPRGEPVVHEPPGPYARDQIAAHEPGQRGASGAVGEPELA